MPQVSPHCTPPRWLFTVFITMSRLLSALFTTLPLSPFITVSTKQIFAPDSELLSEPTPHYSAASIRLAQAPFTLFTTISQLFSKP